MSVNTTLAGLNQTASSNGPDGSVDPPSTVDDAIRYALSFIATLRDGKGFTTPVVLASAGTTNIGAQNALGVEISGTTTITGFGTTYNGPRFLRFTGALTLTHNSSSLILPGGANITTDAGDTCIAMPKTTAGTADGWVVFSYQRAAGPTVLSAPIATTSGTLVTFPALPAGRKRHDIHFMAVSTTSTAPMFIRIGPSGGVAVTGYAGGSADLSGGAISPNTAYFAIGTVISAAAFYSGTISLWLANESTNTWNCGGFLVRASDGQMNFVGGSVALSGPAGLISVSLGGGAFDAGAVSMSST